MLIELNTNFNMCNTLSLQTKYKPITLGLVTLAFNIFDNKTIYLLMSRSGT